MASGRPSHAVLGGSLEPEVILPKLPGWVLSPSLLPESQQISLLIPMLTDAPPFCRPSWAMAQRTCILLATAWVHNWQRRPAGGWGAKWAGSQVGAQGDVGLGRRWEGGRGRVTWPGPLLLSFPLSKFRENRHFEQHQH